MGTWTHRDAATLSSHHRLRLGIGGPSRSGKTYSALRIATGIVSVLGGEIFFIDTDNEFALDYNKEFKFQHVDFQPRYTSERYKEAVEYCVSQKAGVIVVDQMSHEQTGEGGVLQRQEETEIELAAKWKVPREKAKQASWNQAKTIPHGIFVSYITRVKQPMIFNFRAKDKIQVVQNDKGKQEWVHSGFTPICTEQFDYEMSAMLILGPNSDGHPDTMLSEIRQPLRTVVVPGEQLCEELGKRLAIWVKNEEKSEPEYITEEQARDLQVLCEEVGADIPNFLKAFKADSFKKFPTISLKIACQKLQAKREAT